MKGALIRDLHVTELRSAAEHLLGLRRPHADGLRLVSAGRNPELRYVATPADSQTFEVWRCKVTQEPPSLATIWPLLGWYEREVMDLIGIRFRDHPEPNRLVLPQHVPPPLARSGQDTAWVECADGSGIRTLPEVPTEDVQVLPFGPVRADVLEPPNSPFCISASRYCIITRICSSSIAGWKRGSRARTWWGGTILAERVSAVGTVAHALAYCQAVEHAADCIVTPRACWLRVLLAELERVSHHLHYLGTLCQHDDAEGRRRTGQAAGRARQADQHTADRQPVPAQPADSRRIASRPATQAVAERGTRSIAVGSRQICRSPGEFRKPS